jgi:hypothetical protein
MSHGKHNDNNFVTKVECQQITATFREDMGTVKKALVGEDMRGGLVKDVSEIRVSLKNNGYSKGLGKKERALIYTSIIGTTGVVLAEVIRCVAH